MAIIPTSRRTRHRGSSGGFQEEEAPRQRRRPTAAAGYGDEEALAALLERKGGAVPFLHAAIDVARQRSDLFRDPSVVSKVTAMASAARVQVEEEKRMAREARRKAEEAERKAKAPAEERPESSVVIEERGVESSVERNSMEVEQEDSKVRTGIPNDEKLHVSIDESNDRILIRFLKARKFDIDKAKQMWTDTLSWRKEYGTATIVQDFDYSGLDSVMQSLILSIASHLAVDRTPPSPHRPLPTRTQKDMLTKKPHITFSYARKRLFDSLATSKHHIEKDYCLEEKTLLNNKDSPDASLENVTESIKSYPL